MTHSENCVTFLKTHLAITTKPWHTYIYEVKSEISMYFYNVSTLQIVTERNKKIRALYYQDYNQLVVVDAAWHAWPNDCIICGEMRKYKPNLAVFSTIKISTVYFDTYIWLAFHICFIYMSSWNKKIFLSQNLLKFIHIAFMMLSWYFLCV